MATEYKLSYTASEINRKLGMVDEMKTALDNDYYTRAEMDASFHGFDDFAEGVRNTFDDIDTTLATKADLVDGKIPVEQLPDNIGEGSSGGGLTEVAWEDIKNKPFEEISTAQTITWDGNTNGLPMTSTDLDMGEGAILTFACYKISDVIVPEEQSSKCFVNFTAEGESTTFNTDAIQGKTTNGSFCLTNSDISIPMVYVCSQAGDTVEYDDGDLAFSLTFSETGVWFLQATVGGEVAYQANSFDIPATIKTLDIKYLPDNMALGYETKAFEDIIWDGNTDGLPMVSADVDVDGTPMTLKVYKVSDCVLPMASMIESEVEMVFQGEEDSSTMYEDGLYPCHSNGSYVDSEGVSFFCITENNTTVDLSAMAPDLMFEFSEAGIWFLVMETGGMEIQRTTALRAPRIVTKIDVKYLPTDEPYGVVTLDYAGMIAENRIRKSGTVSQWDNNPITSSAVFNALGGREQLSIDDSVTSYSSNPVSSSAVYTAIKNKQINVDSSVQSGSNNAVSSNAVYNAIQQIAVPVTSSDNGKFMRVVNGAWAAVAVPNAEDGEF